MLTPSRFLTDGSAAAAIVERFRDRSQASGISYATVRDYCESLDLLPQITGSDGDLKNVQRPWAVKAVVGSVEPGGRLLEIGGGEPVVSGFLSELGYDVTLVDPYDGFGNGPTDFERYLQRFPHVQIVRDYFRPGMGEFPVHSFDAIFSVSVLEHIPAEPLRSCFDAIGEFLKPGGVSLHCFDLILQGVGVEHALDNAREILAHQNRLRDDSAGQVSDLEDVLRNLSSDVETFYLSPQGHHHWRGGQPYDAFPFRKVVSLQTIARLRPAEELEPPTA